MSGFTQTEKNRTLGQARNVQLGAVIVPDRNGGSPTYLPSGYVKEDEPWDNAIDSLKGLGGAFGDAKKAEAKAAEDAATRQMDMDVYNIQVNPNMSASEKEIRVTDVYNKYANLPVKTKQSILSAHGADVGSTYIHKSEQKRKEDIVKEESTRRDTLAKFARESDPYYATKSPNEQYRRGQELFDDSNNWRYVSNLYLVTDDESFKKVLGDKAATYMKRIIPTEFKRKWYNRELTQQDIQDFKENFVLQTQNSINPFTNTTYSQTEAITIANATFDPMFKSMAEDRDRVDELTFKMKELYAKDAVENALRVQPMLNEKGEVITDEDGKPITDLNAWTAYTLYGKDPATLNMALGGVNSPRFKALANNIGRIKADKYGRLTFPEAIPNEYLSGVAGNAAMPEEANDAQRELWSRQQKQDQTPQTTLNTFEMMKAQKGYYSRVPDEYKKQEYGKIKQTVAADIASNAKSLLVNKLDNVPDTAPWYQKILAKGYNTATSITENIGFWDSENRARDLDSMVKDYTKSLRDMGLNPKQTQDIIEYSLQQLGADTKDFKPLSDEDVPYFFRLVIDSLKGNPLTRGVGLTIQEGVRTMTEEGGSEEDFERLQESFKEEEPSEEQIPATQTTEYRDKLREVMSAFQKGAMTEEQARNELNQTAADIERRRSEYNKDSMLDNVKNVAGRVVNELVVKGAEAATTNKEAIREANKINKLDTKPVDSELYNTIINSELSEGLRSKPEYVSGDNYVVHKDKKRNGKATVGGGVLLNETNKQLLRLAGYNGNFNVGEKIPQDIVDETSVKLFNYKAKDAIRICKERGIDITKHPELQKLCIDAHYNGALPGLLQSFRNYVHNPSKKNALAIMSDLKKKAPTIYNNKDRRSWWTSITNKLGDVV